MKEYLANNWIAILALAISIIALLKDIIKDIIQKKKEDTNNKKAIITARIINKELIISNIGKSDARNIQIFIDDEEINKSLFGAFSRQKDFSLLTNNNSIGIKYIDGLDTKRNYKIKIMWEDDYCNKNVKEDIINL